jgi:hypothetical protein
VIAAVALQNLTITPYDPPPPPINNPAIPSINGNALSLQRLGAGGSFSTNAYQITAGSKNGSAAPSDQSFTREMAFLIGRQTGVPANPTYRVMGRATTNNAITGEAKMVIINNPPSSDRRTRSVNNVASGGSGTSILNNQIFTPIPAGDRVIIAAVQVYNTINNQSATIRTIPAGGIRLRRGNAAGPILVQNELPIDLTSQLGTGATGSRIYRANRSASILLVARDPAGGNNQRYTLQAQLAPYGGGASSVSANGQVVVMGLNANMIAAVVDGPVVAVGTAETVIANLASTLGAGQHVVIAGVQYANGAGVRTVAAGGERLTENGVTQVSSQYGLDLCSSATSAVCDDFASGLLWRNAAGSANPAFSVRALASSVGLNAEAKILALQIQSGIGLIDWLEVFQ